jgi:hypothetical protein
MWSYKTNNKHHYVTTTTLREATPMAALTVIRESKFFRFNREAGYVPCTVVQATKITGIVPTGTTAEDITAYVSDKLPGMVVTVKSNAPCNAQKRPERVGMNFIDIRLAVQGQNC